MMKMAAQRPKRKENENYYKEERCAFFASFHACSASRVSDSPNQLSGLSRVPPTRTVPSAPDDTATCAQPECVRRPPLSKQEERDPLAP